MTQSSPESKLPARPNGRFKLSFLDERDPDAEPTITNEQAQQLQSAFERHFDGVVVEAQACSTDSCTPKARGAKDIAAQFGINVSCKATCKWFWSKGGGWQKECYIRCTGKDVVIEGTA